jgi:hemerythrin-like metal-binding protein
MNQHLPPLILGVPAVDDAHRALLDELARLARCSDQEFAGCYPALVAAIERDFRAEQALMEDVEVISFRAHVEQHARMLSALHHAASHVQGGELAAGREAVALLKEWLPLHISTMDRALVDAAAKRTTTHAPSAQDD